MGIWLSRMLSYFGDREARILVLGLDAAGKTTILCASSQHAQMGLHGTRNSMRIIAKTNSRVANACWLSSGVLSPSL